MVPLSGYLLLAAGLFCIGAFGALARRNAIAVLMGIELMLNSVNVTLIGFARYLPADQLLGQVFALFVITVAAAEVAVGLAIIVALFRARQTIHTDDLTSMKP